MKKRDLIRELARLGWTPKSGGKGSHMKFTHQRAIRTLTVPDRTEIGKGLAHAILKQAEAYVDKNEGRD